MNAPFEPSFLAPEGPGRERLFAIHHPAADGLRGLVVYVHPFAEEMNKSRRMAALQSRQLAAQGWAVVQVDLRGCGDSEGDFAACSWAGWVADVVWAAAWIAQRYRSTDAAPELWLWGLRAGALLAVAAAAQIRSLGYRPNFLFWQPATSGRMLLQQFLRMKTAAEMLAGQSRSSVEALRQQIAAGQTVEVAGYSLTQRLCAGLEAASLDVPAGEAGRALWFEVQSQVGEDLSPAQASACASWRSAGWDVEARRVQGPAFWQAIEIEDAPALLAATVSGLRPAGCAA